MKTKAILIGLLGAMMLTLPVLVHPETLGKVTFPTSCDARVQANFERGVAMLHSYWFTEARKVFEAVLEQDAGCAIAYWGLAVNYLGNSLASAPSSKDVAAAWAGLDKARAIGARTPRERDWIEAISVYYRDADTVALDARLLAYTEAMERMTRCYSDDFEAWTYYALTLQASAPKNDKTYASQLKSAAILERSIKGYGCVVCVVGPAGIGKSRTVSETAAIASSRGKAGGAVALTFVSKPSELTLRSVTRGATAFFFISRKTLSEGA